MFACTEFYAIQITAVNQMGKALCRVYRNTKKLFQSFYIYISFTFISLSFFLQQHASVLLLLLD